MQLRTWDKRFAEYIKDHWHTKARDRFFHAMTWLGNYGIAWLFIAVVLFFIIAVRPYSYLLVGTLLFVVTLSSLILKPLFDRSRPCHKNPDVDLRIRMPMTGSFPSGHTMSSFAAATVLCACNFWLGAFAVVLACCISFSRMYLYVHYLSDVLGGILLGIPSGLLGLYIGRLLGLI